MKTGTRTVLFCMGLLNVLIGSVADASTNRLAELEKLPFGLKVAHTPEKVLAHRDGRSGRVFTWSYKTSVTATNDSVVVMEFGSFVWHQNKWVFSNYTGKPFTSQDFADWYSCPGAKLVRGQEYSDGSNWSGGDTLSAKKMKWYFIGVTSDGRRVKGEADVETLAEVSAK